MASHDEDFGSDLTPIEADGVLSSSRSSPARKRRDWRSLYEQAHARAERECSRADVAEARAEELRWAEVAARSDAVSWKSRFKSCRRRLSEAEEEAKELRRTEKDALSSQAEVARLKQFLAAAGVGAGKGAAVLAQHKIAREPRARRDTPRDRSREARQLSKALETVQSQKDRLQALRHENSGLRKAVKEAETQESTIRGLSGMIECLRERLRDFQDQRDRIRVLSWQVDTQRLDLDGLRRSLKKSEDKKQSLSQALADAQADHRKALRRSRRQKAAIKSLARKNARLRRTAKSSRARIEKLEGQYVRLRASAAVLQKVLFGSRSEQQEKPRSERRRGQQPGAPGHGRTWRPALEEKKEERNPPRDARMCSGCGKPYVMNGERSSAVIEIEVKAHTRRIIRPRWRRGCGCASSPLEVTAPPAPRLFSRTPYGTSVWACVLFERYACLRPLHRVSAWMSDQGLPVSAGTLADSVPRFLPLFEPFDEAIRAHQSKAAVRHGDETVWRIQSLSEADRTSRAWLWTSVSHDAVYFHIDPSRSAKVATQLFGGAACTLFLVCDRLSSYKTMAYELGGAVSLCWCWAHQRRDFIHGAAGQAALTRWCQEWIERIASVYKLNEARLEHYDPALERQTAAFTAAQAALEAEVERLFATAEQELAALPAGARETKALRSLLNHRGGLSVFVDRPLVPMDNNAAERALRGPVIGRRLSFGSDSETGARFTALMYSVVATLKINRVDVRRWLGAWLEACAENGGQPPEDASPWLPWSMSEERRLALMAPG